MWSLASRLRSPSARYKRAHMPTVYMLRCKRCLRTFEAVNTYAVVCGTRCRVEIFRARARDADLAEAATFFLRPSASRVTSDE